jgi:hypothetical protein
VRGKQYEHAATIGADDFIALIVIQIQIDFRVAERPATAITGDFAAWHLNGFKRVLFGGHGVKSGDFLF